MFMSTAVSHRALVQQSASKALVARGFSIIGNSRLFASDRQNVHDVVRDRSDVLGRFGRYQEEYEESLRDSCGYWLRAASELHWFRPPSIENTLKGHPTHPNMHHWFTDGTINTCYNCLDRHVYNPTESRANQKALVYDSPLTNTQRDYTYAELLEEVENFSAGLAELDVRVGDRVVIYMPMVPEAVIAMLACARIGAIHSVVFGGFAAKELASRIDDSRPKVIVSSGGGVLPGGKTVPYKPMLDEALKIAKFGEDVKKCVIVQRKEIIECTLTKGRDVCYSELMQSVGKQKMEAVPLPSPHTHYILYTSGTTGNVMVFLFFKPCLSLILPHRIVFAVLMLLIHTACYNFEKGTPKGVVHDTGGYATALKWSMSKFYNTEPGDVYFAASDIGWVVGHSYTVYGPLLQGCTTVLYEGKPVGTPDSGAFWRCVEDHGVNTLFSAPTAFRAIRQADPKGLEVKKYDLSALRAIFVAGERSDPSTLHWIENILKDYNIPAIDHWWQTELAFPGAGNALGLGKIEPRYGACAAPVPGYDIRVLSKEGDELPPNTLGTLAIKLPLPPGTLPTLYEADERFIEEYLTAYPGFYDTKDAGMVDDDGYVHIMARTDDIINTSGYRLSTGAMEEILLEHPDITDCAVIGVKDALKGEIPCGFVVVSAGRDSSRESELLNELVSLVREKLGPVSNFKKVAVVKSLPKTRSGKVLRGTMRKIANREQYTVTPTIEDPNVLNELTPVILRLVGVDNN